MASEITARDRVWAAIISQDQGWKFGVEDIKDNINSQEKPSNETIRRVLRAATEFGVIKHQAGSPYYSQIDTRRVFGARATGPIFDSSKAEADVERRITIEDTEGQFDRLKNETELSDAEILEFRAEIKREITDLDRLQMGEQIMEMVEKFIVSIFLAEIKHSEV